MFQIIVLSNKLLQLLIKIYNLFLAILGSSSLLYQLGYNNEYKLQQNKQKWIQLALTPNKLQPSFVPLAQRIPAVLYADDRFGLLAEPSFTIRDSSIQRVKQNSGL